MRALVARIENVNQTLKNQITLPENNEGRSIEDRPICCGQLRFAPPAGKAQLSSTWGMRRFETPEKHEQPLRIEPKRWQETEFRRRRWTDGPWSKVLQHEPLPLRVGAPQPALSGAQARRRPRRATFPARVGRADGRRLTEEPGRRGGPGWDSLRASRRCGRTLPRASPSMAATRRSGIGVRTSESPGSEMARAMPRSSDAHQSISCLGFGPFHAMGE